MRVLFDTNVILDVLLDRQPFNDSASPLFAKVEQGDLTGVLGATTLTTIHYLTAKALGKPVARITVRKLIGLFQIAAVDRGILARAEGSSIEDFEDAVLHEAGLAAEVDAVVTRDPKDFRSSRIPVFSPQQLHATLSETPLPPPA